MFKLRNNSTKYTFSNKLPDLVPTVKYKVLMV
jgi:hypothetical protein